MPAKWDVSGANINLIRGTCPPTCKHEQWQPQGRSRLRAKPAQRCPHLCRLCLRGGAREVDALLHGRHALPVAVSQPQRHLIIAAPPAAQLEAPAGGQRSDLMRLAALRGRALFTTPRVRPRRGGAAAEKWPEDPLRSTPGQPRIGQQVSGATCGTCGASGPPGAAAAEKWPRGVARRAPVGPAPT